MTKAKIGFVLGVFLMGGIAVPINLYSLTPPNPSGASSPPVPELIPTPIEKKALRSSTSSPATDLTSPFLSEEEVLEPTANDLPPIVKPSSEEIKEKVILELKELEKRKDLKSNTPYEFPIVINDHVEYFIDYFQTKLRNRFSLWMGRSTRYIPMMKKILNDHGLPEDLIYLAMIESGFSTKAYSRAHAVGPWQFIRETGQRYGLRVNAWVDERKDPVKSTKAAAKHLSDLYNRFGSWYLAAAGYNAGEGKITRALAMYNAQNFWEISADHCRYIKEETKQYVPKMIAAALIAKEPEKYGFVNIPYHPPLSYDEISLPGGVELKDVATACGVEVEEIVDLNPELRRWVTPPGAFDYTLRIPTGTKDRLMENYAQLTKPKPIVTYKEHRIRRGERLSVIAKKYGVNPKLLAKVNRISSNGKLNPGLVLLIPKKGGGAGSNAELELIDQENHFEKPSSSRANRGSREGKVALAANKKIETANPLRSIKYKVRKGDSLSSIAEKFDVEVSMIKKWNPKGSKKIIAGSTLTLLIPKEPSERNGKKEPDKTNKANHKKLKADERERIKPVLYTVRRGDSLSEIAQKFNITTDQIRTWNRLSHRSIIKPGDKLSLKFARPATDNI